MNEHKVSEGVLDSIEFAGWHTDWIKPSKEGRFIAHLIDPECEHLQGDDFGFNFIGFDGTNDGLSDSIMQSYDELTNHTDLDAYAETIARGQNSDVNIVRAELAQYSADIDRLYTCVELSCIKEEIQELRNVVEELRGIETPQKETTEKEKTDKQAAKSHSGPDL